MHMYHNMYSNNIYKAPLPVPICFEDLLKLCYVIILVRLYQVGHGQDLRVVLVRLCLRDAVEVECTAINDNAKITMP